MEILLNRYKNMKKDIADNNIKNNQILSLINDIECLAESFEEKFEEIEYLILTSKCNDTKDTKENKKLLESKINHFSVNRKVMQQLLPYYCILWNHYYEQLQS